MLNFQMFLHISVALGLLPTTSLNPLVFNNIHEAITFRAIVTTKVSTRALCQN